MRKILLPVILMFTLLSAASAFVEPVPLAEQVKTADAILRIVVVSHDALKMNEGEEFSFQALAKCRVIEDYKGNYKGGEFIYIPCAYNFDESPSPIEMEGDYVVMLETMKVAALAHPVAWNAVHRVKIDKVANPADGSRMIPLAELVKKIKDELAKGNGNSHGKTPAPGDAGKE